MNGSTETTPLPEEEPRSVRAPTEFTGVFDDHVISDVHHLFQRKAQRREALLLVGGLVSVGVGIWGASEIGGRHALGVVMKGFTGAALCFSAWWTLRKGWARFMLDQVISGRIHGAGIVVDQLCDRAGWGEFCSARLSNSAALLFVDKEEKTPSVLAFDGLPLHRSFFESAQEWESVCDLIRQQVRKVSLIAG